MSRIKLQCRPNSKSDWATLNTMEYPNDNSEDDVCRKWRRSCWRYMEDQRQRWQFSTDSDMFNSDFRIITPSQLEYEQWRKKLNDAKKKTKRRKASKVSSHSRVHAHVS